MTNDEIKTFFKVMSLDCRVEINYPEREGKQVVEIEKYDMFRPSWVVKVFGHKKEEDRLKWAFRYCQEDCFLKPIFKEATKRILEN